MTKDKDLAKVLGMLEDVYGWNDINELTEIQLELVNDVISVVKKLTIPDVSERNWFERFYLFIRDMFIIWLAGY